MILQPTGRSELARNRHRLLVVLGLTFASFALASWPARPAGATPTTATRTAPALATAAVVPSGRLSGLHYHEVAKGESLKSIAKLYGIPVEQIRSANGMTKDTVYLGARVLLDEPNPGRMAPPSGPATATTYTVVSGDNLAKIAKRNGTTVAALVDANQLKSANQIRIGQVLTVGGAATPGMVCPLAGSTYHFDWGFPRADGARFHEGIDMFAPGGTPILAPVDGTVSFGNSATPGKFATLKGANGWQYYSAHLSKTAAKAGPVKAGDVIGYVGNTGDAKGGATHLHLEIRPLDGRPVNPHPIVTAACG